MRTKLDKDKAVMALAVQVYEALIGSEIDTDDLQDMGQAVVNETPWKDLPAAVKVAMIRVADQITAKGNIDFFDGKEEEDARSNKGSNKSSGDVVSQPGEKRSQASEKGNARRRDGRDSPRRADDGNARRGDSGDGKDVGGQETSKPTTG